MLKHLSFLLIFSSMFASNAFASGKCLNHNSENLNIVKNAMYQANKAVMDESEWNVYFESLNMNLNDTCITMKAVDKMKKKANQHRGV